MVSFIRNIDRGLGGGWSFNREPGSFGGGVRRFAKEFKMTSGGLGTQMWPSL